MTVFLLRVGYMKKFLGLLQEYSIPLIVGIVAALIWANLSPETYEHFIHFPIYRDITIHFLVEDVFMVFFFATAMVEIVESIQPGGSLNPVKRAINPLIATMGGVLGPVFVYLLLNSLIGSPEYTNGWGIPTATDIAIAWLAAKLVFGDGHPAINYLLLLAIVDDALGLIIIAIFYPTSTVMPIYLLFCLAGMVVAFLLRRFGVKSYWWYILLGGIPCWYGLHSANVHAALALVFIIPFLPVAPEDVTDIDDTDDERALEKFNRQWKPVVDFGMFFFGLCNAGVVFFRHWYPHGFSIRCSYRGQMFWSIFLWIYRLEDWFCASQRYAEAGSRRCRSRRRGWAYGGAFCLQLRFFRSSPTGIRKNGSVVQYCFHSHCHGCRPSSRRAKIPRGAAEQAL